MDKNISKEVLEQIVKNSKNFSQVLKQLNVIENTYNRNIVKNLVQEYNINIDHFKSILTKDKYELNPKFCKYCGKKISYEHRENEFCDHSCAANYNNKENKDIKLCLNCGNPINTHNKFCNNTCYAEYNRKEYIKRWKNGEESGLIGKDDVAKPIKLYLRDKYSNSCQCCGWNKVNPFTGIVPLQIHHIDGDCTNNKEENLQLLCPNCHTLTENFGSRNNNCTRVDKRIR